MSEDGELPEGWAGIPLAELLAGGLFADGDWVESKDQDPDGDVRLVQLADVGDGAYRDRSARFLTLAKARELGCTFLEQGDVLIARMPDPLGRACIFPGDAKRSVTVVDVCVARPAKSGPNARWLMHTINSSQLRRAMDEYERGTTRKRISRTNLGILELPVPPLPEQHRIVEQVEALLAQVNRARDRLDRVKVILKKFRQAVLAAACSGKLTEEWRSRAENAPSAEPQLQRVLARHRAAWIDRQRATPSRSRDRYTPPEMVTHSDLPDLPEGWSWIRLGLAGADPLACIQTGPFGAMLHREEFVPSGVPVIAVGNLTGLGFSTEGLYFVNQAKADELGRFDVSAGDLLFARSGATLGKVCVAPPIVKNWRMTGHILRARLDDKVLLPSIAAYALWGAAPVLAQVSDSIRGVTRPGYNTSLLEEIHVPLAPLDEQAEIIKQVERLFALADAIEARLTAATTRAEKLPQAILSKAFKGELVPTEAELARAEGRSFESAEEMLKRVIGSGPPSRSTDQKRRSGGRQRGEKPP